MQANILIPSVVSEARSAKSNPSVLIITFILTIASPLTAIVPVQDAARHFQQHFWAEYLRIEGKAGQAVQWAAGNIAHHAPAQAYKSYVPALFAAGDFDKIVPLIPKIESVFPDDPNLGLIIAQALEETGDKAGAAARYIQLNEKFKGNHEIAYHAIEAYVAQQKPKKALDIIDKELNSIARMPNRFVFYFLKSQILTQMGKPAAALVTIKKCVELQPMFDKGWLLLAILQEQEGKINDAIKGYTNFLEIGGGNKEIENHLIQLIFKQKMVAQNNNKVVVVNKDCFAQALQLFENHEYAKALTNIEQCMAVSPEDPEYKLLKIQILTALGKHTQVLAELKQWIMKEPVNERWYHLLMLLPKAGVSHKALVAMLTDIERQHPKQLVPALYLADCHLRSQDPSLALPALKKAVALTDDNSLKTKIYFQMGVVHYNKKEFTQAKQVLEQGNALHTDFPPLLNLLAYYYATQGNDLVRSQQLMNLVLQYDSKNPHFLDTQALIYYQQKNYPRALKMWRSIAPAVPDDFLVQMHLGQAFFMTGKKTEAISTLKKAQLVAINNEDKQQCLQLLQQWEHPRK